MKQLFLSECSRYKKSAAIFFLVMLMAFAYSCSDRSPFPPSFKYDFINILPMLAAAVFGLIQMYLHKRANHWAYLIHRPLSIEKIFMVLVGAGATIIFAVTTLPFLLGTLYLDLFTFQNIDLRDYSHIFAALLKYYVFYLISCLVILNASKGSALMYLSFFFLIYGVTPGSHLAQFLPVSIFILILLYLNNLSFKPDVKSFSKKPLGIVLHSTSMMTGILFLLLIVMALSYEIGSTVVHGKVDPVTSKGTMRYFSQLTKPEEILGYALEETDHPNASHYVSQAEIADSGVIRSVKFKFPFRGQTFHAWGEIGASYLHAATNTRWQFSHDSMLMEGRNLATNESEGFIGMRGFLTSAESIRDEDRFSDVPIISRGRHLMTPQTLYYIDFDDQLFEVRQQLRGDERYVFRPTQHPSFWALNTNQRLMLFDKQDFNFEVSEIAPEHSVPYPVRYQNLDEVRLYELVDGYLLQFMGQNFYGDDKPGVEVVHSRLGGEVEHIGGRAFTEFYIPAWRRQMEEIIAPLLFYAFQSYEAWARVEPNEMNERYRSLSVYPHMIFIQAISFIVVLLMCRRQGLNRALTMTWAGLAGLFGLPALISFFLLNPWIPLKRLFDTKPANQNMGNGSHEAQPV